MSKIVRNKTKLNNKSTFTLEKLDAAIILRENKKLELCVPKPDIDPTVPTNVVIISVIALLLQESNKPFLDIITKKYNELLEETSIETLGQLLKH